MPTVRSAARTSPTRWPTAHAEVPLVGKSENVWRVRGQELATDWDTRSPIGSQGGEFIVSTVNYNDILVSFDIFFTTQGEAKMCVLYTTDNWVTTNVAANLFCRREPDLYSYELADDFLEYSPDTVTGTYFYQTTGQGFYNNLTVDLRASRTWRLCSILRSAL